MKTATRTGTYHEIDGERLAAIAAAANLSEDDAFDICCNQDWEDSEHQEWLDTAPIDEIADWAAAAIHAATH